MMVGELLKWAESEDAGMFHLKLNSPTIGALIHDWKIMHDALLRTSNTGHDINANEADDILSRLSLKA